MARSYCIYDVFTETPLAGNPLAVVFDAEGLDDAAMQAVACEFNLSETIFILPALQPAHAARVRIFTPGRELPFAGHPTVGAAIALAERDRQEQNLTQDIVTVLEEKIGPVRCAVSLRQGQASFAEFDLPKNSQPIHLPMDRQGIADALGLKPAELGFENHQPSLWSAGVPFMLLPVNDLSVAEKIEFDPQLWERVAPYADGAMTSAYVYCRGGVHHKADFHARMFSPDMGIAEDPATGSAVAALSGAIQHFDALPDGHHPILVEQGVEMGRPSFIHLHIDTKDAAIFRARIGGCAIRIATGILEC
ncbi:PhzF family phenazine biosynthesis protein [Allorhizobium sp. BGMRC 0089]|uniref:PhzF family phenazine biosynthesis protein n=1 Tax=Allorhizobium sonneratiae TaxID=2934936 RepID=UPI002034A210|nr:PhzF family phenazine biosynthesis protein [Allorhizobium sonneratiae]MCM2292998.1 PhzF family phenazine biosynthesis protein [Allorhizobium sonneratiae]